MHVLVTGGTGFIGSHIAKAAIDSGHTVRLFLRDPTKVDAIFSAAQREHVEVAVGDMTDRSAVDRALKDCEAVIHAAAVVGFEAYRAAEIYRINTTGTEHVVGGAQRMGMGSITYVSSSSALYREGAQVLTAADPLGDSRDAYGRSKIDCDRFARKLQETGAPIHITYPTGVIGPDDPGLSEGNHTLCVLLKTTLVITETGFQPVDVRDVATLHARLLDRSPSPDRTTPSRHLAAGQFMPWPEVAQLLEELTGTKLRKLHIPGRVLRGAAVASELVKRFVDFDFPLTQEAMRYASKWILCDASAAEREFGIGFRSHRESLRDTLTSLVEAGHLDASRFPGLLGEKKGSVG